MNEAPTSGSDRSTLAQASEEAAGFAWGTSSTQRAQQGVMVDGTPTSRADPWVSSHYSRQDRDLIERALMFVQSRFPDLKYEYGTSIPYMQYAFELARLLTDFQTFRADSVTIAAAVIIYPAEVAALSHAEIVDQVDYEVAYLVNQVRALRSLEWRIWEPSAPPPLTESERKQWAFKHDVLRKAYQWTLDEPGYVGHEGDLAVAVHVQKKERRQEGLIRMLLTASPDIRGLIVVLADRLCLNTLLLSEPRDMPEIAVFARLTLDVYAPLADRLGMWSLKSRLETAAFRLLYPDKYDEIAPLLTETSVASGRRLEDMMARIQQILGDYGIWATVTDGEAAWQRAGANLKSDVSPVVVTGRKKHAYSIFRKMQAKNLQLDQIHDLLGVRIVILWSKNRRELEEERRQYLLRREELLHDRQVLVDQRASRLTMHNVKQIEAVEESLKDKHREIAQVRESIQAVEGKIAADETLAKGCCYDVLRVLAEHWSPRSELYGGKAARDWIDTPKPNRYQSLHTTLMIDNQMVEVQIRTLAMHAVAEYGAAAAHWRYQAARAYSRGKVTSEVSSKDVAWTEQLTELRKSLAEERTATTYQAPRYRKDRIFVITPMGDVVDLSAGASPIDFAYRIHTERGHTFAGAKVNDRIVRNDYELQNGDIVELLPGRGKGPSVNWLATSKDKSGNSRPIYVRTAKARHKIRSWLRHHGMLGDTASESGHKP